MDRLDRDAFIFFFFFYIRYNNEFQSYIICRLNIFFFFEIENWREIVDEFFWVERGGDSKYFYIYRRIELEIFFLLIENSFEVEVESWSDLFFFFF